MLGVTILLYYTNQPANSPLGNIVFAIYAGGIAWTLLAYYRSPEYTGRFGDIFGKGFRCFIVVAVIMVTFIVVFNLLHPEIADQSAELYRQDLIKKGDRSPDAIESMVAGFKKQYTLQLIYPVIFGYLIVGSLITAAGAGLLLMRRK